MRIVLFLGAGFSAPFSSPVMNNFSSFVESSTKISDEDKEFYNQLLLDARQANSFLESSPTNLEDILSFAIMGDRLGLINPSLSRIKNIIRTVYTQAPDADTYWERYDVFKKYLGFDLRETQHELSIITTNYDLNIESALNRVGRRSNPGFQFERKEGDNYSGIGKLYSQNGTPLFKLHGSVNWYEDAQDADAFVVEDRIVSVFGSREINAQLPLVCANNYKCEDLPIIIPPSYLKPEFQKPVRKIWEGAAKALEETKIIAFVGYSFPPVIFRDNSPTPFSG